MPNYKADIHQWAWYRSRVGKFYLCTAAGWCQDAETNEWQPQGIHLLEYLTTEPKPITLDKMLAALQSGELTVVKLPY